MSTSPTPKRKRLTVDPNGIGMKRRKETTGISITIPGKSNPIPGSANGTNSAGAADNVGVDAAEAERVRELGTRLWLVAREARANDGRNIALDFVKLPNRRQYPDYYTVTKRPIALEEIQASLDQRAYTSLEAVKADLDLCFKNAKRYNVKDSPIWLDARALQKLVSTEYKAIAPVPDTEEDVDVGEDGIVPTLDALMGGEDSDDDDEDDDGDEPDDADGEKRHRKPKTVSLYRHLKNKLQKLVKKAPKDADGISYAEPFTTLPNRKLWPDYYKLIKKPLAFDTIFKKIKRKEYESSNDFAADVDLVFDNALQFNEDNSPVWLAARTLRPLFYKFMAELPPEFAFAPRGGPPKIKLRVQTKPGQISQPAQAAPPAIPTAHAPAPQPAAAAPPPPLPPNYPPVRTPARPSNPVTSNMGYPQAAAAAAAHTPRQPQTQSHIATPQHRTPTLYQPQPQQPSQLVPHRAQSQTKPPPIPKYTAPSPTPDAEPVTKIKSLTLVTAPANRVVVLRQPSDLNGVSLRCWAIRLGFREMSFKLAVDAIHDDDDDGSIGDGEDGATEADGKLKVEVKCNGTAIIPTSPPEVDRDGKSNGNASEADESGGSDGEGKNKTRGAGRPRATRSGQVPPSKNGKGKMSRKRRAALRQAAKETEGLRTWDVSLALGANTIDVKVGGAAGESWRIFAERSF